ncbi:MAG: fimbrial assembly protein [Betaproteobacteria bacterium]|nr:fimbrial assembly protein [Betaproteobacteria bacterium]
MLQNKPMLFGIDLTHIGSDLRSAWAGMLRWPWLAWLRPQAKVQVIGIDSPVGAVRKSDFLAVQLPEDLLLRRSLLLPAMGTDEIAQAVQLDLQANSPFAPEEIAWVHRVQPSADGRVRVDAALTSHALVGKLLHEQSARLGVPEEALEVRVAFSQPSELVTLSGYGEARRSQRERRMAWAMASLVLLLLALLAALAVTPSLQLRLRAIDAAQAYAALAQKAGPTLAQREELVRRSMQLQELNAIVAESAQPLPVLEGLTKALSDETWLQTLQLQGTKVTMTGQTPNAAALMRQLGALPGVSDVKAPTAAIKPPGAPKEVFTIEFVVDASRFGKGG